MIIFNNSAALLLPINKKTNEELSINAIINRSSTEALSASNSIGSTAVYGEVIPIVNNVKTVLKIDKNVCADFNVLTVG